MLPRGDRAPRADRGLTFSGRGGSRHREPAVDVAIVNWNTSDSALRAAGAYLRSQRVRVTVTIVDNNSEPNQRNLLSEQSQVGCRLEFANSNLGYARAANLALRDGRGDFVCVSNADVIPQPGALSAMVEAARSPSAGMIGPVFDDATHSYHDELPGTAVLLARTFIGSAGRRTVGAPEPGQKISIGQPSGACFLVRRDAWQEIGGFDEGFFLWYEDVDLAKRLIDSGRRNQIIGSARVEHGGAGSFQKVDRSRWQRIRLPSLERYIRKHHAFALPLAVPLLRLAAKLRSG